MANQITHFHIEGLHGLWDIDIPIVDNTIILVGENGKGKSTVVNILYLFLSGQLDRLAKVELKEVSAVIDNTNFTCSEKEDSPKVKENLLDFPPQSRLDWMEGRYVETVGMPRAEMCRLEMGPGLTFDNLLFLPTYRRIEQDLSELLGGDDRLVQQMTSKLDKRGQGEKYKELVQFGMEDVTTLIDRRLASTKEAVRKGLSALTGSYLKDMIRGEHLNVDQEVITTLTAKETEMVFARIDDQILPAREKKTLFELIRKIQEDQEVEEEDKKIAYFLSELIQLHREQQVFEGDLRKFVHLVNKYLMNKELIYENASFELGLRDADLPLSFGILSSGEKQIVSLFAHLLLSEQKSHFLIIDEPELSLSVPWQRNLLPDLLGTGRCSGIVAVTHSPFIYDNNLEKYTHAMDEFVEVRR